MLWVHWGLAGSRCSGYWGIVGAPRGVGNWGFRVNWGLVGALGAPRGALGPAGYKGHWGTPRDVGGIAGLHMGWQGM